MCKCHTPWNWMYPDASDVICTAGGNISVDVPSLVMGVAIKAPLPHCVLGRVRSELCAVFAMLAYSKQSPGRAFLNFQDGRVLASNDMWQL